MASRPCALNSSVHAASTAASTTGRYSGRQPASTAFTATFSTVHSTRSGGITATISSGARVVPVSMRATRSIVGATTGRPSVHPRANIASCSSSDPPSSSRRDRMRGVIAATTRVGDVGVVGARPATGPEVGEIDTEIGEAGQRLPPLARPAFGAFRDRAAFEPQERSGRCRSRARTTRRARCRRRRRLLRGRSGRPASRRGARRASPDRAAPERRACTWGSRASPPRPSPSGTASRCSPVHSRPRSRVRQLLHGRMLARRGIVLNPSSALNAHLLHRNAAILAGMCSTRVRAERSPAPRCGRRHG